MGRFTSTVRSVCTVAQELQVLIADCDGGKRSSGLNTEGSACSGSVGRGLRIGDHRGSWLLPPASSGRPPRPNSAPLHGSGRRERNERRHGASGLGSLLIRNDILRTCGDGGTGSVCVPKRGPRGIGISPGCSRDGDFGGC